MKRLFHILLPVILLASCKPAKNIYLFTSFREPATDGLYFLYSNDGLHWTDLGGSWLKPEVGGAWMKPAANAASTTSAFPAASTNPPTADASTKTPAGDSTATQKKIMRDPSMAQGADGVWRLVWTCGWNGDKGFGYASSHDLIHWSKEQFIPVMEKEPDAFNVWAPEIFYEKDSAQFQIVWATTIPYRFPKGQEDEKNNHRLYCTTTKDFVTFTPTRLYFDPGYSVIDAMVLQRGPADYVLVFKDNTRLQRNIKVAFGDNPAGPWHNDSRAFTPEFSEGPTVAKVGKEYYIYYDGYRAKKFGAVKTSDFKTFTDASGEVSVPIGHKHGTIVMIDKKTLKNLLHEHKQ